MLALAATDAAGALLFAALYAMAGAEVMSQGAFVACLPVVFGLVTAMWLWAEARHRGLSLLRRVGRGVAGLLIALGATPALMLMPLFWLDSQLPPEAGSRALLAGVMTLLLIALVLVVAVNAVGWALIVGRTLLRGAAARRQGRAAD